MSKEEVAWVAGLIEGEGCIRYNGYSVLISVAMCDEDVLRKAHAITGLGNVTGPYMGKKEEWTPSFQWNIGKRQESKALLDVIYPWLGQRRKEKIDSLRTELDRPSRQGARTDLELSV